MVEVYYTCDFWNLSDFCCEVYALQHSWLAVLPSKAAISLNLRRRRNTTPQSTVGTTRRGGGATAGPPCAPIVVHLPCRRCPLGSPTIHDSVGPLGTSSLTGLLLFGSVQAMNSDLPGRKTGLPSTQCVFQLKESNLPAPTGRNFQERIIFLGVRLALDSPLLQRSQDTWHFRTSLWSRWFCGLHYS